MWGSARMSMLGLLLNAGFQPKVNANPETPGGKRSVRRCVPTRGRATRW